MERVKNILFYAGLDAETFEAVRSDWDLSNMRNLKIYSAISTGLFFLLTIANNFANDITSSNSSYYLILFIMNVVILICANTVVHKHQHLSLYLNYIYMCMMYWFGMKITILHSDMPAVIAVTLMLAVPFFFIDRPIHQMSLTLIVAISLVCISHIFKSAEVARMDLWNTLAVAASTMAIEVVQMRDKFQGFANKNQVLYLSQTDVLTGAKNRNTFEGNVYNLERNKKQVVVAYADINGLHEMNNTKGHAAGDLMLKTVASALIDAFGNENTYRIGGDEFVVLMENGSADTIRENINTIVKDLDSKSYHVSIGVSSTTENDDDIDATVKTAEREMYQMKADYYQKNGIDRRRARM